MPNYSPIQTEEFKRKRLQPVGVIPGDFPLGKKTFTIKLPVDVEEKLLAMPKKERISLIRNTLISAVRKKIM